MKAKQLLALTVAVLLVFTMVLATGCNSSGSEMTLDFSFGQKTGTYAGETDESGLPNGTGSFTTTNSEGKKWTYEGEFVHGHMCGEGTMSWESGYKEIGTYADDEITPMDEEYIDKLYNSPDEYEYHCFELTGEVFNIIGEADGKIQIQMNEDIENAENNTIVMADESFEVSENDYIRVKGIIRGTYEYENMIGEQISAVLISAKEIKVIDYKDAVSPTINEIPVDKTITRHGYSVTVQKVEFAKDETRVYVEVENNGKSTFSLYSFESLIVQNKSQYSEQYNWNADYPEVQTDLRKGNTTSGVIAFPAVKQSDFKLILCGSSDDWDENINDFEFEIKVE